MSCVIRMIFVCIRTIRILCLNFSLSPIFLSPKFFESKFLYTVHDSKYLFARLRTALLVRTTCTHYLYTLLVRTTTTHYTLLPLPLPLRTITTVHITGTKGGTYLTHCASSNARKLILSCGPILKYANLVRTTTTHYYLRILCMATTTSFP